MFGTALYLAQGAVLNCNSDMKATGERAGFRSTSGYLKKYPDTWRLNMFYESTDMLLEFL